jgi:hypothetical protein
MKIRTKEGHSMKMKLRSLYPWRITNDAIHIPREKRMMLYVLWKNMLRNSKR